MLKAWLHRVGGIVRRRDEDRFASQTRLITVLFSNMRDYVSLCERIELELLRELITAYFSEMTHVVSKHNGTVDKFIGDCFSAIYNAPLESPDHALKAVQTALELQECTRDFSRRWEARAGGAIRCGVGISTGYALVTTMGSKQHLFGAMGAAVDLAQRLESLTKEYEVPIVISETTHQHLAGRIPTRELRDVVGKGTAQPVKIFGVWPGVPHHL